MMCPVCPDLPKTVSRYNFIKKLILKQRAKKSAITPMICTPSEDEGINMYKCKICYYGFRG